MCRGTNWAATNVGTKTTEECMLACDSDSSCNAFDISPTTGTGTCYLFSTTNPTFESPSTADCYHKSNIFSAEKLFVLPQNF